MEGTKAGLIHSSAPTWTGAPGPWGEVFFQTGALGPAGKSPVHEFPKDYPQLLRQL